MSEIEVTDAATAIKAGGGACRIAEKDYHADPCPGPSLSSGVVRLLHNSTPAHAWHAHPQLNPDWRPDVGSKRMALGSTCHNLLLGAGAQLHEISANDYRTKAAKEERDAAAADGFTPILSKDLAKAEVIVGHARKQLLEHGLDMVGDSRGDAEVVVLCEAMGGWKRIMVDWWSDKRTTLVDYKTIDGSASPEAFARRAAQMDYDIQDAFYLSVAGEAFPELAGRMRFLFVVQEISPPYCLSVCEIAEADRSVAVRKVADAERVWFECMDSGKWPGYPTGVQRIAMPGWHNNAWLERELMEEEA